MEVPSHRACAHCRSQKVRCIIDDDNPDTCQRCAKSGRSCVFTPLQKRKQRKRTDTRVAELEREMRAMRAALQKKEQTGNTQSTAQPAPTRSAGVWFEDNSLQAQINNELGTSSVARAGANVGYEGLPPEASNNWQRSAPRLWPTRFANKPAEEDTKDVVDAGLISMATARQLFETYRRDLCPTYPIVVIPESATADEIRKTRPALFLAIIAAAAGKDHADLAALLDKEVLHAYAMRHVVNSEKSLELVQALLVSAVWYHPPTKFGQLKYYEYIHMAATMAMDIGIGTRSVPHRNLFAQGPESRDGRKSNMHPLEDASNPDLSMTPRSRDGSPDTGSLESRRTFLACYIVCSGVSMSLRRPNMLRSSSYIRECLEVLERSSAAPTDRNLAAWVKLNMIAEEICNSFSYDDPGDIASITEMKTHFMLKDYEKRLSDWYSNTPETDTTDTIIIMYYSIRIYLHEVALHVDHSPEDFKAPFQMGPVHPWHGAEVPTQILAEGIADCISSAHNLMNTFTDVDPEKGRCLPVFVYVRISFAAFVLAKLCLSAAHQRSRIGMVLDRSSLKVEDFLDRAILHVRAVVGTVRCRVPAIFLALLFKLRQWCMNPQMIESSQGAPPAIDVARAATGSGTQAVQQRSLLSDNLSNTGNSSQTHAAPDARQEKYSTLDSYADDTTASLATPDSHAVDTEQSVAAVSIPSDTTPAAPLAGFNASTVQPTTYPYAGEMMDMDPNFFQFLGDINALSQGGLTGLDDWSMMAPVEYNDMEAPDVYDWQSQVDAT